MSLNQFELHTERLATTDEQGHRVYLQPADVRGKLRTRRVNLQYGLILFFLALPWLRINGKQALLLNVGARHFEIFGLTLRAHNAPLLFFVLALLGFGLFFATSVFGRIWCGWACPQTVFIDGVYRRIERWIEGDAIARRALDKATWTGDKILKRAGKWFLYVVASLILTHSFLAYFVGTEELAEMIQRSPSHNLTSFLFMLFSTGIILFDFAWFREQFCIIACPYGRFQSVLMDPSSLVVSYDSERGEPRATPQAKALSKMHGSKLGACVNCYRCVQVCPTGIDIRRGVQMECIACTSCIDACDEIMTKVKQPTGLIRYAYGQALERPKLLSKPRSLIYLTLSLCGVLGLFLGLSHVNPLEIQILRAKDAPYTTQTMDDGTIMVVNHMKLELSNQSGAEQNIELSMGKDSLIKIVATGFPLRVLDGKQEQVDIFLRFPKSLLQNGQARVPIFIHKKSTSGDDQADIQREVTLVGPFS